MAKLTDRGIPLCAVNPRFLHTNSTSHTGPFSAIAELIDNAYDPDVSAKQFWIDKTYMKEKHCLIFMDNGKGMDYDTMYKMLSFGFNDKKVVRGHVPVGRYGNGFKSGSMRLGKNAIVFSKKGNEMCVGLLSQTYLEESGAQNVIVPIVMFTKHDSLIPLRHKPEHAASLNDILKYSLFNTLQELMSEFSVIEGLCAGSTGTRIIIWSLCSTSSHQLEFDFTKDSYDFQIPADVCENYKEKKGQQSKNTGSLLLPESEYSLRAYCSILYLKPRMQIILQGQKVETQFVTKTLANVCKDSYKPVCVPPLKKPVPITFGYNTKSKEHYGLMIYHNNRLIKAYERVTCQRKVGRKGVGVIGVMECNYLTPTHNKQDFDNTEIYKKTMQNVGSKLEEYWNEVRYRYKDCDKPVEDIVKKPDQTWVQCDDCLKWRKLADGIDSKKLPKKWFCHMNSDPKFRNCEAEEQPEDTDDENFEKTYKLDKAYQKTLQDKNENREQSPSMSDLSFAQTPSFYSPVSSSHTGSNFDNTSANTQDNNVHSTLACKRKLKSSENERPQKKSKGKKSIPESPLTSTKPNLDANSDCEIIECERNKRTHDNSEYQKNYLQDSETIKQLQSKVASLEYEKYILEKDLEEIKRQNIERNVHLEDRGVQTDSSHDRSNLQISRLTLRELKQGMEKINKVIGDLLFADEASTQNYWP